MSAGSSLPYRLRPNKAVDRELFLGLLMRLAPYLSLEKYQYVGLGGPFLEDFRLIHGRLGITVMTCVDSDASVHKRQEFNKPIQSIKCVHSTLETFLDATEFESPVVIWFDYTDPGSVGSQVERFSRSIHTVPLFSVLRITLNANPESLGDPEPDEISVPAEGGDFGDAPRKPTMHEWRLSKFRERLGQLFPTELTSDEMTHRKFGKSVLKVLKLAVERVFLHATDRKIIWALATHYKDGQAMATATLIVVPAKDVSLDALVKNWIFFSTPDEPHKLDLPALSTLERLTMESSDDPKTKMGFDLPRSDMGVDPFEVFRKFYRIYPHFSRVEL